MPDLARIKGNVAKMVEQDAARERILEYIEAEGVSVDMVRDFPMPEKVPVGVGEDVAKSIAFSGIPKGITAAAGLAGDVIDLGEMGGRALATKLMGTSETKTKENPFSSQNIRRGVESFTGPFYTPKTTPGEYSSTLSEFGVMAPRKLLAAALAGGTASEAAGQMTEGSPWEPYARMGGAVMGFGLPGAVTTARGTLGGHVRDAMKGIDPIKLQMAQALLGKSYQIGSPITAAEAVSQVAGRNTNLLSMQRVAENSRKGAPVMDDFMKDRPAGVNQAFNTTMSKIGKPQAPVTIPARIQEAAEGVVRDVKRGVTNATKSLYEAAEKMAVDPEIVKPILKEIDDTILRVGESSDAAKVLKDLRNRITSAAPKIDEGPIYYDDFGPVGREGKVSIENPTAGPLIQTYKETRDALAKRGDAEGALAATVRGLVKPINRQLGDVLEAANKPLKLANEKWQALTRGKVEPVEMGPVGKVAQSSPETKGALTGQYDAIVKSDNVRPEDITMAVKQLAAKDPVASRDLMVQGLTNEFEKATKKLVGGENQFGGAKFASNIDTARVKAYFDGLPDGEEAYKGLRVALDVFEAQGKRFPVGSPTEFNAQFRKEMSRGGMGTIGATLLSPSKMTNAFRDIYDQFRYGKNTRKFAEIITDPKGVEKLVELGKLPPDSPKAQFVLGELLAISKAGSP